ncbi:MAG: hypothetical protein JWO89_397 [Verrucomicrobiaceae bacterium]|nr:hypothetical protein [Verrucomicrobiaceae bacterium]
MQGARLELQQQRDIIHALAFIQKEKGLGALAHNIGYGIG